MKLEEVCALLSKLEQDHDVNRIQANGIALWPLIRQCIWAERITPDQTLPSPHNHFLNKLRRQLHLAYLMSQQLSLRIKPETTTAFVSQPENLQVLASNEWFDRIIDPLIHLEHDQTKTEKFYLRPFEQNDRLVFSASVLCPTHLGTINRSFGLDLSALTPLFQNAGLPVEATMQKFRIGYQRFLKWYHTGLHAFGRRPHLRRIYFSSWYVPENMGLIAAARELGIQTVDVQHGKQGRFQAMYSCWTCIPEQGYQMLPDWFWCWGEPSSRHMLLHSGERKNHKPFVGGFPWPDYYRHYISTKNHTLSLLKKGKRQVLFTLQRPVGTHIEPIPDFILKHLSSENAKDDVFIFRGHPNFPQGLAYCRQRLKNIAPERLVIHEGRRNLYDELQECTHHITAFSSCCYEAEMFGVPTFLFGDNAQGIYMDDIHSGRFGWTLDSISEFTHWLEQPRNYNQEPKDQYIHASLPLAKTQLTAMRTLAHPDGYVLN